MRRCFFVVVVVLALCAPAARAAPRLSLLDALSAGDLDEAARLAKATLARQPRHGVALFVLARVKAKRGDAAAAVPLYLRAEKGVPPAPQAPLAFHAAAALQKVGRYREAEGRYLEAARLDPSLAATATLSAATAALDREDVVRARALADEAAALPDAEEIAPLLADLRAQLDARAAVEAAAETAEAPSPTEDPADAAFASASAAYREGRYAEAAKRFRAAARLRPDDPEPIMMEGLARYQLGQTKLARRRFEQALKRDLRPEDRSLARTYLDMMATPLPGESAWTTHAIASVGAGYDSNVAQTGTRGNEDRELAGISLEGTGFGTASLMLGIGRSFGPVVSSELGYSLYQVAYGDPEYDDMSSQDHTAEWLLRVGKGATRFALSLRGDYSMTGLRRSYEAFQRSGTVEPELALSPRSWTTTRLSVGWTRKETLDPAFTHLGGDRLDFTVAQQLRLGGWLLALSLRHREELVGERRGEMGRTPDGVRSPCVSCDVDYVTPYSYRANAVGVRLSSPFASRLRFAVSGRAEDRPYKDPSYLEGRRPGTVRRWDHWRRHDRRFAAGTELGVRLGDHLAVILRYDLAVNRSNVDGAFRPSCLEAEAICHPNEFDDRNYVKHLFGIEVETSWF